MRLRLANVVGYNVKGTAAKKYPFFGSTFVPLQGGNEATTFKLGSLKAADCNIDDDWFQILDPDDLSAAQTYAYLTKEIADVIAEGEDLPPGSFDEWIGWWSFHHEEPETYCNMSRGASGRSGY